MKNFLCSMLLVCTTSNFLFAQMPTGFVAKYPLDGTVTDISGNNYNGTLTSVASTSNRFGTSNSALQFTSGISSGTLPVVVTGSFSVGFWIKTSMNANGGSQWYSGNSLVDAEVCGVTNDWGVALINGGKIAFGTGNPDKTIISSSSYNDGLWHFITATRNTAGSGTMILYVDGSQVASLSSVNVSALNAPAIIGLGRNNCTGADYSGSIDDLIFYGRTLSNAEVSNMFTIESAVVLPLTWVSFSGEIAQNKILLQWQTANDKDNDHFNIERSFDAQTFSTIGTLTANGHATNANVSFSFEDAGPENGINYYRIKQTDIDGTYTYSKILAFRYQNLSAVIKLLSNPVQNSELIILNAGNEAIGEMAIVDLTGRVIMHQQLNTQNGSIQVRLNNLTPGYYFIQVNVSARKITIPFIKGS
ncbi:MAG TPA: LamG-like jellyroll fold domain-containing protein [Puia sp.]|nr:LamG-like jellyroll fold domain-containing protein [Puia sp.]